MIEKDLMLLIALPFLSVLIVTLFNLVEYPFETIYGLYKFQLSFYNKMKLLTREKIVLFVLGLYIIIMFMILINSFIIHIPSFRPSWMVE